FCSHLIPPMLQPLSLQPKPSSFIQSPYTRGKTGSSLSYFYVSIFYPPTKTPLSPVWNREQGRRTRRVVPYGAIFTFWKKK
ncbi:MAG: hypothetical protein LBK00_10835, partial [Treponema sp.]|nr:hypothetical protein [Treponema sp.]